MKRIFLSILFIGITIATWAQNDVQPDYLKNPVVPEFRLLMQDSSTIFNTKDIPKGKPIVLIMFSPDCHHCEELTASIIKNIDKLKNTRIYMLTPMTISMIKPFYEKMELAKYKNILVGKDHEFFFPNYYKAYDIPFIAVYDKNKKFVKTLGQNSTAEDIAAATK
jgi:thiol-disulfide isomerase/thioredoxin